MERCGRGNADLRRVREWWIRVFHGFRKWWTRVSFGFCMEGYGRANAEERGMVG